jgi:hypothetical protein
LTLAAPLSFEGRVMRASANEFEALRRPVT